MFDLLNDIIREVNRSSQTEIEVHWKGKYDADMAYAHLKDRVKAKEMIEEESDPKKKRRMQILMGEGIYDFTNIDKYFN
jgi:hypothetical protein